MTKYLALLLLIHGVCSLQDGNPLTRVGQFSAQVAVSVGQTTLCGGTIVNINHVVTSARCVLTPQNELVPVSQTQIRAGITELNLGLLHYDVQAIFPHPMYNPFTEENDIAVIRVSRNFTFNFDVPTPTIEPAIMNERIVPDNTQCEVSGWNAITHVNPVSNLTFLTVAIRNRDTNCNTHANHNGNVRENMICAGQIVNNIGRLCTSSRGGGLYCNGIFVGVASFGFHCGTTVNIPPVYTQVRVYRSWIIEQFSRTEIPPPGPTPPPPGGITTPSPDGASSIIASSLLILISLMLLFV